MRIRYVRCPSGRVMHVQMPMNRTRVLCPARPTDSWDTVADQDAGLSPPPPAGQLCANCNRLLALLRRVEQAKGGGYKSAPHERRGLQALARAGHVRDSARDGRSPSLWLLAAALLLLVLPAPAWAGPRHPEDPVCAAARQRGLGGDLCLCGGACPDDKNVIEALRLGAHPHRLQSGEWVLLLNMPDKVFGVVLPSHLVPRERGSSASVSPQGGTHPKGALMLDWLTSTCVAIMLTAFAALLYFGACELWRWWRR